ERDALSEERRHAATLQESLRRRNESLERERRDFAQKADERLGRALREFATELERRTRERGGGRSRVTASQTGLLRRVLGDVHRDLGLAPSRRGTEDQPPEVSVGDTVFVESLGGEGTLAEDYGDTALVALGSMRTVVSKLDLTLVHRSRAAKAVKASAGASTLEAAARANEELDVRGKRFVEAEPLVEKWIDEAKLLGLARLRLIHGKGTGLLGRGLQQHLRQHDDVRSVRYGNADEGGSGVTVLELR
ncbi:MAG: Smr/MutS family protein, partial [Candidatus Eremiobacteraeota bacterium]|nr:Smr/MutS family protein [Candidatus Eremiobacteraeota bacterium]